MSLNRQALRAITQDDIGTYRRDGVVMLRGVLNRE